MSRYQRSIRTPSPTVLPPSPNTETPVRQKHVSGTHYRSGDLAKGRVAVLRDLGGSIPEVPVEWFLKNIVPQVALDHEAVRRRLLAEGHIQQGRWSDFPADPAVSTVNEAQTFKPFESVVKKIVHATDKESYLTFFDNPHRAPLSNRSNETRPDSYFVRPRDPRLPAVSRTSKSENPLHHWDDIALSAEYKKGATDTDKDDNAQKMIWSMHHVMRSDPCRRFTYGFTVENTQMRIWFACRSKVFVTTAFNFIQDHDKIIQFVISCSYALDVDLGWDPTIKRVYTGGAVQYDITVHDVQGDKVVQTVFRTTRVITDFGADALRGRGTRVYEAFRLDGDHDALVAIKDVWVDADREREGDIRSELERQVLSEDKAAIQRYFMTVLNHGDVVINARADHTLDMILRGHELPSDSRFLLNLQEVVTDRRESSTGAHHSGPSLARVQHTSIQYQHKVHYRIVFKEVARPVHLVTYQSDFFRALEDATSGLELLHKYDWVHRDISSGNLLFVNGRGKLSDLEYTKKMSIEGSHEIRTGTMDFMSLEVEDQEYLFFDSSDDSDTLEQLPPFRYNPLHDLESLWWIGVWMIFYHRPDSTEQDDKERDAAANQQHIHQAMFPGTLGGHKRFRTLTQNKDLLRSLDSLPPSCRGPAVQLNVARRILVDRYKVAEAGPTIDSSAFTGVHLALREAFCEARKKSADMKLRSLADILRTPKRLRGEDEENRSGGGRYMSPIHKHPKI